MNFQTTENTMIRIKNILFPVFALILGLTFASAQSDDDPHGMGSGMRNMDPQKMADRITEKLAKELNLNADQKTKLHQLIADGMEQMKEMRPMQGEMHGELMKQMRSASLDTAAINKEFETRQEKMRAMHAMHIQHFAELHAMLTPEQRNKLADFIEKRGKEMKDRWMKGRMNDKGDKDKDEDSK